MNQKTQAQDSKDFNFGKEFFGTYKKMKELCGDDLKEYKKFLEDNKKMWIKLLAEVKMDISKKLVGDMLIYNEKEYKWVRSQLKD